MADSITLSILVPTLAARRPLLDRLLDRLRPQLSDRVEVLTLVDAGEASTGAKRNKLVAMAQGQYLVHLDDDDLVPVDYVARVLDAVQTQPDAVGYSVRRYRDGVHEGDAHHSSRWPDYGWQIIDGRRVRVRPINHICPHRTELARLVPFPDITRGEDIQYTRELRQHVKSEVFIDQVMYEYWYTSRAKRVTA